MDFYKISTRPTKRGSYEIYPKFVIRNPSQDLMIRGGDFYAVWLEDKGLWSTSEQDALQIIDRDLDLYLEENRQKIDGNVRVLHMWDAESGMIDKWHKYCQKQMRDSYHMLDEKLIFTNTETVKKDYASKKLPYPLEDCDTPAYDRLMSVLYSPEERHKLEWAIGSIFSGDSKKLQKFVVLYGAVGTGKSTVLNIIQQLFEGYYSVFDARALGSSNNSFALEAFRTNPLVAIQHDGDLSHIEDNTRLNSLVSHELMMVNEKFKSAYSNRFISFLFMGTNKPVKITDAKSGLLRRLIDVTPSGDKLPVREYNQLVKQVDFELGGIAIHCLGVYEDDPDYYNNYIPVNMMAASNDFYNFVEDSFFIFKKEDGVTLQQAWEMYKTYCDEAKIGYPLKKMIFQEELKNYFRAFSPRMIMDDGTRPRNYYSGFRADKFERFQKEKKAEEENDIPAWLDFQIGESLFDKEFADCPAQYASAGGTPIKAWEKVKTKLKDLDTSLLHYVQLPIIYITADFDIPDDDGNKSLQKNLKAAAKWPPTYAELSKSGSGIHLHYIYTGDPKMLERLYDEHVEIKVMTGNSALRRKLTRCNNLPIATISSGLPIKKEKEMIDFDKVKSEKGLRSLIERNLRKEIHPGTKPSIDFIFKILEDAYNDGLEYDLTNMKPAILSFAAASTHQSEYCVKLVSKMKFKSETEPVGKSAENDILVFYDVEVFPNLFLINWKAAGEGTVTRMINPTPNDVEELMKYNLIGFNCRRYDNHILYARLMGYTNEQLYDLSQKIINGNKGCFFGEAYNVSYTDVYDFASSGNKKSLKKFEIELNSVINEVRALHESGMSVNDISKLKRMSPDLVERWLDDNYKGGIHHQELGLPWDQPVPEELWPKVAEYCDNDVISTEATFYYLNGDWTARQILADLAGMTVNDTTNSLTTRIIFGTNRHPQDQFNYRFMGAMDEKELDPPPDLDVNWDYTVFEGGKPVFPGYVYANGKSTYRGEEVGEGGYVYSEPGIYTNVALLDIASMHPSSIVAEELFGPVYTKRFRDILDARLAIKHEDWPKVRKMLDGKLDKYVDRVLAGELTSKQLANALKTAINSVYGLTDAGFENPFRDPRNVDNIVAKRGALFMVNLKHEVQKRGYTVAHIKTDSIKIPDATPEIIQFVMDYGKLYGYSFEHEATYERMCLVNDAVYIARYLEDGKPGKWTATGTQFQVPYVFKKCFSHEDIVFDDMCETKAVTSSLYLDMNEDLREDEHNYVFIGRVGRFCPIKPGCGGGLLMREKDGKYYAATGSKGWRWQESEVVKELGKEDNIDISYYEALVADAKAAISEYGNYELFASDSPYTVLQDDFMNVPVSDEEPVPFNLDEDDIPPWEDKK